MGRPKLGKGGSERLQMVITSAEMENIEVWRYANRVPSKSEAIRRLCKMALVGDQLSKAIQTATDRLAEASMDLVTFLRSSNGEGADARPHRSAEIEELARVVFEATYDVFDRQVQRVVLLGGLADGERDLAAELEHSDALARYLAERGGSVMGVLNSSPEAMAMLEAAIEKRKEAGK